MVEQVGEEQGQEIKNLTISNRLKGVLAMDYCEETKTVRVVENPWKQTVQEFQGAFVTKKFKK